jgi:hypothetical protein
LIILLVLGLKLLIERSVKEPVACRMGDAHRTAPLPVYFAKTAFTFATVGAEPSGLSFMVSVQVAAARVLATYAPVQKVGEAEYAMVAARYIEGGEVDAST